MQAVDVSSRTRARLGRASDHDHRDSSRARGDMLEFLCDPQELDPDLWRRVHLGQLVVPGEVERGPDGVRRVCGLRGSHRHDCGARRLGPGPCPDSELDADLPRQLPICRGNALAGVVADPGPDELDGRDRCARAGKHGVVGLQGQLRLHHGRVHDARPSAHDAHGCDGSACGPVHDRRSDCDLSAVEQTHQRASCLRHHRHRACLGQLSDLRPGGQRHLGHVLHYQRVPLLLRRRRRRVPAVQRPVVPSHVGMP
eukprot:Amastigsp_a339691_29.p3 type:complete len:255 gc:universal Amastigsp_a339691_29:214-978(+)